MSSPARSLMKHTSSISTESIAKFGDGLSRNALSSGSDVAMPGGGGTQFAKFNGNTGSFTHGASNAAIPPDQVFIIPAPTLEHGWMFWQAKKPEKDTEVFVSAAVSFPAKPDDRHEVGGYATVKGRERDGWQRTWKLSMTGYNGLLDTISVEWPGTSNAYQQFWSTIVTEVVARIAAVRGTPQAAVVHPVLKVVIGSYANSTYDKEVYFPTAEITHWTDGTEMVPYDSVAAALASAPAEEVDPLS